jgi:HEAT repeat protein
MATHKVKAFDAAQGARANELLGFARALSSHFGRNDDGQAFDAAMVALAPTTLTVHLGKDGFVRTPTPPAGMRAFGARPALTPPGGAPTQPQRSPTDKVRDAEGQMVTATIMQGSSERPANDLYMRLRGDFSAEEAPMLLDEVARGAEAEARKGDWVAALDVATRLLEREQSVTHPDVKRSFGIQFRRLGKGGILRGIAQLLPRQRDQRDRVIAFLQRQGDPAADVVVELLVGADSSSERRAYRDAVAQLPAAAEPLQHLLRDHRWFVVRNAAELLGEMNATEADQDLINTLRHSDTRVRRAATLALIRLGTPRALHTIIHALRDAEPSVRLKAALGLGAMPTPRAPQALLAALDAEDDAEVQQAILAALGRQASDDAVERLVRESGPGPLLKRRPVARRLAAVAALGEAATPAAYKGLESLKRDKDTQVRELAQRLLSAAAATSR